MGGGTAMEPVSSQPRWRMEKFEVYRVVLQGLRDSENKEASQPGFEVELCNHFDRFPPSYATEVNVLQPEDVITHMRLLRRAEDPTTRPAFEVRIVQFKSNVDAQTSGGSTKLKQFFEIAFSTVDKPKLLNQLTSLLSEIGLNIEEAHAFSTSDGYALDVFVVYGWPSEETEQLKDALEKKIPKIEIEDINTADKRIASRLKIEQTAKALQEARVRVQLLEEEHALAVQEDLAIASVATSSPQLGPDDSVFKDVLIRFSL
ncbi:serine/threonine-protein kinase STY17-like [Rhododendron vialii]|uniref:serine/threonine-protein kinase STY17-like n=1 Tax=Rhododendron vialii TaxID=182163 RepID=UPI00265F1064|nr:serine/threonine-protein kinase STY17-like [Rhododendron vialii]